MDVSKELIVFSNSKKAAAAELTRMGPRRVTGELARNFADHCYFHTLFRCGGECGSETPLLRSRPSSVMVRVVHVVRPTAAALSTTSDAQDSQRYILEVYGGLCYPVDNIRLQFLHSFQRKL